MKVFVLIQILTDGEVNILDVFDTEKADTAMSTK